MARHFGAALAVTLGSALALAGCSNSTPESRAGLVALAGEYTGTAQDSVAGAQTASTTLAQHGSTVGGTLTLVGTGGTNTEAVAWTLTATNTLSGTGTETVGQATCTFSMTGSYNTSTNEISGSYTAVSGCAGTTGTYVLDQQCSNPTAGDARRTLGIIAPC